MADIIGPLILIGGHEDKKGDCTILQVIAERTGPGRLVIATLASSQPEDYFEEYKTAFGRFGFVDLVELYIEGREEAQDPKKREMLEGAAGIFFTGGDQLKVSSQIGDTPIEQLVREILARGGVVAGTSAGASVMGKTMLVKGMGLESQRIGDLHTAPGLGLMPGVIIDQHFAERGRIGRLLGAVAQNPQLLGIGIDENTAIIVENDSFSVIGVGAVTVIDGTDITFSNIAETAPEQTLSLHNIRLHTLSKGDSFDLTLRKPARR